jgi:acetylglutamate kinase
MTTPAFLAPAVLKLGGRALEGEGAFAAFARELALVHGPVVLVHGGGAEVSAWMTRLGLAPRFHEGRRVTDAATLDVATAVLAGLANKRLVAALRAHAIDAIGIAALDGGLVECVPHDESAALGLVGQVTSVCPALLEVLIAHGRVPVVASIGAHAGSLLNLNADDVACALAAALGARQLLLLSDTPGLRLGGSIVARVSAGEARALLAHPEVEGGMRPKLAAAADAVANGAQLARIARWEGPDTHASLAALLDGGAAGTLIHPDPAPGELSPGRVGEAGARGGAA